MSNSSEIAEGASTWDGLKAFYSITLTLVVLPSCAANALVIAVFYKGRLKLLKRDFILSSLSACNMLQALFGYVPQLYIAYVKANGALCALSAFSVTFFSIASIGHLSYITGEFAVAIIKPYIFKKLAGRSSAMLIAITVVWTYGLLWAVPPLFHVARYTIGTDMITCTVDWMSTDANSRVYHVSLFVFAYALPISLMTTAFYSVRKELANMNQRSNLERGLSKTPANTAFTKANKNFKNMVLTMSIAFIVAWTPYAAVSLWTTITLRPPSAVVMVACALFAKSSTAFNPVIFTFRYKRFRLVLSTMCRRLQNSRQTSKNPKEMDIFELRQR